MAPRHYLQVPRPYDIVIRGQIAELLIIDKVDTYLGLRAVHLARSVGAIDRKDAEHQHICS